MSNDFICRRSDRADKKVSLRLSVPEAKVMSSSLEEEERRDVTKERLSRSVAIVTCKLGQLLWLPVAI